MRSIKSTKKGKQLYEELVQPMENLAKRNKLIGVAKMSKNTANMIEDWIIIQNRHPKLTI